MHGNPQAGAITVAGAFGSIHLPAHDADIVETSGHHDRPHRIEASVGAFEQDGARHQDHFRGGIGPERRVFARRSANYRFIDMDDRMRQAILGADAVLAASAAPAVRG